MPKEKNETIDPTQKIILPPSGDSKTDQELIDNFLSHSEEEYRQMGEKIEEEEKKIKEAERKREEERKNEEERKKKEKIEKLKGDTDAILKDLKENYVKVEKNAEMMGYKGEKVHINLPAVGNFEGFRFDYFVSEDSYSGLVRKKDFQQKPELKKKSYSMKEISKLLHAMNKYMIELKGNNDGNMDYENNLKDWKTGVTRCNAGDCLKAITGLDDHYWLIDKYLQRLTSPHIRLACRDDNCCFDWYGGDVVSRLLLRLSD